MILCRILLAANLSHIFKIKLPYPVEWWTKYFFCLPPISISSFRLGSVERISGILNFFFWDLRWTYPTIHSRDWKVPFTNWVKKKLKWPVDVLGQLNKGGIFRKGTSFFQKRHSFEEKGHIFSLKRHFFFEWNHICSWIGHFLKLKVHIFCWKGRLIHYFCRKKLKKALKLGGEIPRATGGEFRARGGIPPLVCS